MKINALFEDESGVSPVIGVILMVAITVILAAVIGTFVLNLGQNVNNTAPTVSFNFEGDADDGVTIVHNGGAELAGNNININNCNAGIDDDFTWTAGGEIDCSADSIDGPIRVIWEDPGSDQTSVIGEYEA